VIDRDGLRYTQMNSGGQPQRIEDPNGNYLTGLLNANGVLTSYQDTLGRSLPIPPSIAGTGSGYTTDFSGCTGTLPTLTAYIWTLPGYQGGQMNYKICYANVYYGYQTCVKNGGPPTCGIYLSNAAVIQSIVLPNNTAWTFQYDSDDPNNPAGKAGNLLQVTLPTGGYIKYAWASPYICQTPTSTTSTTYTFAVVSRAVNANDGTGDHTWTYGFPSVGTQSGPYTTFATDPLGQKTIHTITTEGGTCSFYETQTQTYDASGSLVKTVTTDYHASIDPLWIGSSNTTNATNVVPIRTTTTWPNGQVNKVETDYDAGAPLTDHSGYVALYGIPVTKREYNYGSGGAGSLARTTVTNYQALGNSSYLSNNLLTLPSSVQVNDGGGTQRALTTYAYDNGTPTGSGVTTQHETPPNGNTRGNQTSFTRWLNSPAGSLSSTKVFFDTGEVYTSTTPKGNVTTSNPYMCTGAFPQVVTNAKS
jgi:hypothetical protein